MCAGSRPSIDQLIGLQIRVLLQGDQVARTGNFEGRRAVKGPVVTAEEKTYKLPT